MGKQVIKIVPTYFFFSFIVQKICMVVLLKHRGITVIEEQRQVVLGSAALFTKVGQRHIHITYDREEG